MKGWGALRGLRHLHHQRGPSPYIISRQHLSALEMASQADLPTSGIAGP